MERRLSAILAADMVGYSRLMEADEVGTLERQKAHRKELINPAFEEFHGRIVKEMGDGLLVEFSSVVEAVQCAVKIQQSMPARESDIDGDHKIIYRVGINVGDIVIDGEDILGDGVNVASRLESIAGPGGIAVSGSAYEHVLGKLDIEFEYDGEHKLKNIARPIKIWMWDESSNNSATNGSRETKLPASAQRQEIRYCTSADGTALAYAAVGDGPPLFKAQHFMTHLEHDWNSPTFGPFYRALASKYHFIRLDQRGNGLSDRAPENISFEHFVEDFEAVANATGIERFPIYGLSQGSAVAVTYAVRHPERVSCLVLQGGYVRGRLKRGKMTEDDLAQVKAMITLIRTGWGQDNPAFRHMFSNMFIPAGTTKHMDSFDEMMSVATEPDMAARIFEENCKIDTSEMLNQVRAPTLILHSQSDSISPFDEGRRLAAGIPNAELVELHSPNHIILHDEPEMQRVVNEIDRFISQHPM